MQTLLHAALDRRLTTVVAGAGFGKSTLLASWARETPCAWYTLDAGDATLATCTRGLLTALHERLPGISSDLLDATVVPQGGIAAERAHGDALAAHLAEALEEHLAEHLVLVFDDLQELDADSPGTRFVEALCRHAPPRLHLVIASRVDTPFPIERMRGRGDVLTLDPGILAFSREEVSELLSSVPGPGGGELAGSIHEMTGGWPAAVRLAVEALRGASPERVSDVLEGLRRPGGQLFSYLAEEVFEREPPGVRELLSVAAAFPRFTIELCERVGVSGARATIASILRRGLFVQPAGTDGWYTLHALVRDFALSSWPLEPRRLRSLHRRAAAWFESQGLLDETLRSLSMASDEAALAEVLAKRGRALITSGGVPTFISLASALPEGIRPVDVEELLGEAYIIQGRYDEALACLQRVVPEEGQLPPVLAWRLARIYADRGGNEKAIETLQRAVLDGSRPADEAVLLAALASAEFLLGRADACRATAARALQAAEASGDARALGSAHGILMLEAMGRDPETAAFHHRLAVSHAGRARDVLLEVRIRANWAGCLADQGRYDEALAELDLALPQAELAGYLQYLAVALNNRAEARLHLGMLDQAVADLRRALAIVEQLGARPSFGLANLGRIFRERGDLALARASCEQALSRLGPRGALESVVEAAYLAPLLADEEPERARELADQAVATARSFPLVLGQALLSAGWVALATGDRERAEAFAREVGHFARTARRPMEEAESLEILALCRDEPQARVRGLLDALTIWRGIGHPLGEARAELALARLSGGPLARVQIARAERRLRDLGVNPSGAAGAAGLLGCLPRDEDQPLEVRTLGGFRVLRHGQTVSASDWQSKKARDLLKILIARRGRPVPRDVLMDALWPEEDSERVGRRLSVALATTRAVLDPEHRFPSEHFIGGNDAAVWLVAGRAPVDVELFLAEASAGLALHRRGEAEAREVLESAEASYGGDFLEEDAYEDWATGLREEARAAYVAVARALAEIASAVGEPADATRYRLRLLERDPYDEEAHLGLVRGLAAVGQHGEARRAYRAYVARMGELGVEPASFPHAAESRPSMPLVRT